MVTKKKKLGALGPAAHWLDLSPSERAKTKEYIKDAFKGYERTDGTIVPSVRRIYKGLSPAEGYDLRHIERWSAARLATARNRIQSLNTLTSRPFAVIIPHSAKQRKQAQSFTGQNLPYQKEFIVQVQDTKTDKVKFKKGKVTVEREFKGGEVKQVKQRYLFKDYLKSGERIPITFAQMRKITERMLPAMPKKYYGRDVYYTLTTAQYGPIGNPTLHERVLENLAGYHERYDNNAMHQQFAEQVIGYTMIGTGVQADTYMIQSDYRKRVRRKLRFTKKIVQKPKPKKPNKPRRKK